MEDYSDDEENSSISSGYDSEESYESEEHNIKGVIGNVLIGGIKQIEEDYEDENIEDEDEDEDPIIDDNDYENYDNLKEDCLHIDQQTLCLIQHSEQITFLLVLQIQNNHNLRCIRPDVDIDLY